MNYFSHHKPVVAVVTMLALTFELLAPALAWANIDDTAPPEESATVEVLPEDTSEDTEKTSEEESPIEPAELPDIDPSKLSGESEVTTGEATAATDIDTEANSTDFSFNTGTEDEVDTAEETTALEPVVVPGVPSSNEETFSFSATNTATTTTTATTTADTGSNLATGGSARVSTGDAVAYTDVLNVVNTNIVDSTGLVDFVNETLGVSNFDLTDEFEIAYQHDESSSCSGPCESDLEAAVRNDATIDNDITVIANSGGNTAGGSDDATIETGDAYASANIINVANTTVVDSQYLLLVFNNFSNYAGDIILPNSDFFATYFDTRSVAVANSTIQNTATIDNNVAVTANTGDNITTGGVIDTGNATARGDITNLVNHTQVGGGSFNLLIRVHGDWSGSINGLPDGFTWRETERGIEITGDTSLREASASPRITSSNTADVTNDVKVYALTGDNEAAGPNSSITTGDAYADASIMNVVNTNIISSNWTNLIFTIFGDWSGNLTFGQSDLWLGIQAASEHNPIMPGDEVEFTFTVFNRGDLSASGVRLNTDFDGRALGFIDGPASFDVGTMANGETREFVRTARVSRDLDRSVVTAIPLLATVMSTEHDANEDDNTDSTIIHVGEKEPSNNDRNKRFPSNIELTKTVSQTTAAVGDIVEYTLSLFNHGGQLYDAMLVDTLYGPDGEVVLEQSWPLELIHNWEDIAITYQLQFDERFPTGTYINEAQVVGFHTSARKRYQRPYESELVRATVQYGEGRVLGLSTDTCPQYLTTYMRRGAENNFEEVMKLQTFLKEHMGANVTISGEFDFATELAVRDFQQQYRTDILGPWGTNSDTGYVYYTTQKKINEIMCQTTGGFPLSQEQMQEIDAYRANLQGRQYLGR